MLKTKIMNDTESILIAPSIFSVKAGIGTKVYFMLEGVFVEGKVGGYFGHITADKTLEKFTVEGAQPAEISNVGYCVESYVPVSEDLVQRQVYLLDESEIFFTKEDLVKSLMDKVVELPKDQNYEENED